MTVILPDTSKLQDYEYPKIAERFYRETAYHELTILHDDGLYRHLRMRPRKDKGSSYWYEIVTWPGNLAFRGDGESFTFARLEDMFEFFRSGLYRDGSIHINASYWAEKLTSNRECVRTYEEEHFSAYVRDLLKESEEVYPGLTEAWEKATDSYMAEYDIHHEQGAWEALQQFSYGEAYFARCSCGAFTEEESQYDVKKWARDNNHQTTFNVDKPGHHVVFRHRDAFTFELSDLGDFFKDYDWWFLWSLYGIVKAIKAYDELKGHGTPVDIAQSGEVVLL